MSTNATCKLEAHGLITATRDLPRAITLGPRVAAFSPGTTRNLNPRRRAALREALPTLTDDAMKGGALYQLGFVNFKMGEAARDKKRLQEALRFSQQSAAIKSPYQATAAKNVAAIRAKIGPSAAK